MREPQNAIVYVNRRSLMRITANVGTLSTVIDWSAAVVLYNFL